MDFSAVLTCPKTTDCSAALAETRRYPSLLPLACVPHNSFPSILTTAPFESATAECTHSKNVRSNSSVLSNKNTRRKVSCEAIPPGNSKNLLNHSCLARPNSAISSQLSAPQMLAQMAIIKISTYKCRFVRSTRGSVICCKLSKSDLLVSFSINKQSP